MTAEVEKPLKHFIDNGISVIPTRENGSTIGSWKDRKNFSRSTHYLNKYWKHEGIRRFQLHPYYERLIVLDIDRKNGKDGLKELTGLDGVPNFIRDIFALDAYSTTPSNGFHFYFKMDTGVKYRSMEIRPGLEVVHFNHLLTAPGSVKNGKRYQFFGDIKKAPPFPASLKLFLEVAQEFKKQPVLIQDHRPGNGPNGYSGRFGGLLFERDTDGKWQPRQLYDVLSRIEATALKNGGGRNDTCFSVANFAAKVSCPEYTIGPDDVFTFLQGRVEANDFNASEIKTAVNSGFKRQGR